MPKYFCETIDSPNIYQGIFDNFESAQECFVKDHGIAVNRIYNESRSEFKDYWPAAKAVHIDDL